MELVNGVSMMRWLYLVSLFGLIVFHSGEGFSQTGPRPQTTDEALAPIDLSASETGGKFDFLQALDYPELQVVPRASDRLMQEANYERTAGFGMHLPFQISAGLTLVSGLLLDGKYTEGMSESEKSDMDYATKASMGIGIAWLGFTHYLARSQPYMTEASRLKIVRGRDRRSDLMRERLAEEGLERSARLLQIVTWTSLITNLAINGVVAGRTQGINAVYPGVAIVASFLPLVFQSRYITNYEKHLEYKRKIYAPIAWIEPIQEAADGSGKLVVAPRVVLAWRF